MLRIYLTFLFMLLSYAASVAQRCRTGNPRSSVSNASITIPSLPASTALPAGIVFSPVFNQYYVLEAGNVNFSIYYSSPFQTARIGLDLRGVWWNPVTEGLEGNIFQDGGIGQVELNATGAPSTRRFKEPDVKLGAADALPTFNPDEYLLEVFRNDSVISYNRSDGKKFRELALVGVPSAVSNSLFYTGIQGHEYGLVDRSSNQVILYDRATGSQTATINLPTTLNIPASFGISYTNSLLFIFDRVDGRTWKGFSLFTGRSSTNTPISLTPKLTICEGNNTTVSVLPAGQSYHWQPEDMVDNPSARTVTVTTNRSELLFATVFDASGCATTDTVRIEVVPQAQAEIVVDSLLYRAESSGKFQPDSFFICLDESFDFFAAENINSSFPWIDFSYRWKVLDAGGNTVVNNQCSSDLSYTPTTAGLHSVILEVSYRSCDSGCSQFDTVYVNVEDKIQGLAAAVPTNLLPASDQLLLEGNDSAKVAAYQVLDGAEIVGCHPFRISFGQYSVNPGRFQYLFEGSQIDIDPDSSYFERVFNNTSLVDTAIVYPVQLVWISENACHSDTISFVIKVFPKPESRFINSGPVSSCGTSGSIVFRNFSNAASSYVWDFGDGSPTISKNNQDSVVHTFTNFSSDDTIYSVSLIAQSANGCSADTSTLDITIFNASNVLPPDAAFTMDGVDFENDTLKICDRFIPNIISQSGIDYRYYWEIKAPDGSTVKLDSGLSKTTTRYQFTNPNRATTNDSINATLEEVYEVRLIIEDCDGRRDSTSSYVAVIPVQDPSFTIDLISPNDCSPVTYQFNLDTTSFLGSFNWNIDGTTYTEPNPVVTFSSKSSAPTGSVQWRLTTSDAGPNSCNTTASGDLTIPTVPSQNLEAVFYTRAPNGDAQIITPVNTNAVSCGPVFVDYFVNRIVPRMDVIENGSSRTFLSPFVGGDAPSESINFDFQTANGTPGAIYIGTSRIDNLSNDTTLVLEIIGRAFNTLDCFSEDTLVLQVLPDAVRNFEVSQFKDCDELDFTRFRVFDPAPGDQYEWTIDGQRFSTTKPVLDTLITVENGSVKDQKAVSVQFKVTNQVGCGFDTSYTDTLQPANVAAYFNSVFIVDTVITIVNDTISGPFGNTQIVSSTSLNFVYDSVLVDTACGTVDLQFLDFSENTDSTTWYVDDQIVATSAPFNFLFEGDSLDTLRYEIKMVAISPNGCADSTITNLVVFPAQEANFSTLNGPQICGNDSIELFFPHNAVPGYTYEWYAGYRIDTLQAFPLVTRKRLGTAEFSQVLFGSTLNSTTDNFFKIDCRNPTDRIRPYPITLIAKTPAGCVSEIEKFVTISPELTADFVPNPTTLCNRKIYEMANLSNIAADNYAWDFDGAIPAFSNDSSPVVEFPGGPRDTTTYDIQLVVWNSNAPTCRDTIIKSLQVFPTPISDFSVTDTVNCVSLTTTHQYIPSAFPLSEIDSLIWIYGDGTELRTTTTSPITKTYVYNPIKTDNFNNGRLNEELFSSFEGGVFNGSICGSFSGNALVFNQAGPRFIEFREYDFSRGGTINFSFRYGSGADGSPCDGPELGEQVVLEYSTNGGASWFNIPGLPNPNPFNVFLQPVSITIPAAAHSKTTRFRLRQVAHSGEDLDVWAIDQFEVNNFEGAFYRFKLVSVAQSGCRDTAVQVMTVYPSLEADFSVRNASNVDVTSQCSGSTWFFSDSSSTRVTDLTWYFGADRSDSSKSPNPSRSWRVFGSSDSLIEVTLVVRNQFCVDSAKKTIRIRPEPNIQTQPQYRTCNSDQLVIPNPVTNIPVLTYRWISNRFPSVTQNSSNYSFPYLYFNSTNGVLTDIITLQVTGVNGCQSSKTFTVFIDPQPTANFGVSADIGCNPLQVTFTDSSFTIPSRSITSWEYDFGDGSPILTRTTGAPFTYTFTNPSTTANASFTVTLIVSDGFCSDTATRTVTVLPIAGLRIAANPTTVCGGSGTVNFVASPNLPRYIYDFGDGTIVDTNTRFISHQYSNTTNAPIQRIVTVQGFNLPANCSTIFTDTITVFPNIDASFMASPDTICSPISGTASGTVIFTNTSTGGANVAQSVWDFGDGSPSVTLPGIANATHTYPYSPTDRVYTATLTISNADGSCTSTASFQIFQRGTPAFDVSASLGGACGVQDVNFTIFPGNPVYTSYIYDFGDGNSDTTAPPLIGTTHSYNNNTVNPITYQVTVTGFNSNGCRFSDTIPVTVFPSLFVEFTADKRQGCDSVRVNFTNLSRDFTSLLWDFGDGTTSTDTGATVSHTFVSLDSARTFTVILSSTKGGCTLRDTAFITVFPSPRITSFTADTLQGCANLTVEFTALPAGLAEYYWNFDDGTVDSTVSNRIFHTFTNPAGSLTPFIRDVQVSGRNNGNCTSDTLTQSITIFPQLDANFSLSANSACGSTFITFNNTTIGGTKFYWDFGDGSPIDSTNINPSGRTFINNSDTVRFYTITMRVTNDFCEEIVTQTLTLNPKPVVTLSADTLSGCSPLRVNFTSSPGYDTYIWDFGDGSTTSGGSSAFQQSHTYVNGSPTGNFTARVIASNSFGCRDTAVLTIQVPPNLQARFSSTTTGCGTLRTRLNNISQNFTSFKWIFESGAEDDTRNSIDTVFTNSSLTLPDTVTITLVAFNNFCSDTFTIDHVILPKPIVDLDLVDSVVGCPPVSVRLQATPGYANYRWRWENNQGFTSLTDRSDTSRLYSNSQFVSRTVTATVIAFNTFGCADTASVTFTVPPRLEARFSFPINNQCQELTTQFFNNSINSNRFIWDFGGGDIDSTNANPTRTFTNTSQFTPLIVPVTLIAFNDFCSDTVVQNVVVNPRTFGTLSSSVDSICAPDQVNFRVLPDSFSSFLVNYGDGTVETNFGNQFFHTYTNTSTIPITRTVQVVAQNSFGCTDTMTKDIIINPTIAPAITQSTDFGCGSVQVIFENTSPNTIGTTWDFGNGTTSSQNTDTVTFTNLTDVTEIYRISMINTSVGGCIDSAFAFVRVGPQLISDFTFDVDTGCSPLVVNFTNQSSSSGKFYEWVMDTLDTLSVQNPTFTFPNVSSDTITYEVKLIIFESDIERACSDTSIATITVVPQPRANFRILDSNLCSRTPVRFENTSDFANRYRWEFDSNNFVLTNADTNVNFTFFNDGNIIQEFPVTLVAFNEDGCETRITKSVFINPTVDAFFSQSTNQGCHPLTVDFNGKLSFNVDVWTWDFGGQLVNADSTTSFTFNNLTNAPINYQVTLTGRDTSTGCVSSFSRTITVFPKPDLTLTADSLQGQSPLTMKFRANAPLVDSIVEWQLDGQTFATNADSLSYTFVNTSDSVKIFTVFVRGVAKSGCSDSATLRIAVYPALSADFSLTPISGCTPIPINAVAASRSATDWRWSVNGQRVPNLNNRRFDTTLLYNGTSPSTNASISLTTFIVFNGDTLARTSETKTVTIFPKPEATLTSTASGTLCENEDITFTAGVVSGASYRFEFGDGFSIDTTSNSVTYQYENPSLNTITFNPRVIVTSTNGCKDTASIPVSISSPVVAGFSNAGSFCGSSSISFRNTSFGATSYLWDFGDGTTSNDLEPSHNYGLLNFSGDTSFVVTLVARNIAGCEDTVSQVINLVPAPFASFELDSSLVFWPNTTITVVNTSVNTDPSVDYTWQFGNAQVQNPISDTLQFTFTNLNRDTVYLVELNAINDGGCISSVQQVVRVRSDFIDFDFDSPNREVCAREPVSFTSDIPPQYSLFWEFGDGFSSTAKEPVHFYDSGGLYSVTLTLVNNAGDSIPVLKENFINVRDKDRSAFVASPTQVEVNEEISFTPAASDAVRFKWFFGNGDSSDLAVPIYRYEAPGSYSVTLITFNDLGCSDTVVENNIIGVDVGNDRLRIPNAFHPNLDGPNGGSVSANLLNNTVFFPVIDDINVRDYRLEIYNKWGKLIFVSENPEIGWDGYEGGRISPMGAYLYHVKVQFFDGEVVERVGDVTLIR